ncbi:hypothetical protein [Streptomyces sp. LMG1-1-1.1]|uniref:hypothetical protein n=1 Tax=Streptomyces sp. LMG1-1-1.1 TaxID=3135245 RepID=UPI0034672EA6
MARRARDERGGAGARRPERRRGQLVGRCGLLDHLVLALLFLLLVLLVLVVLLLLVLVFELVVLVVLVLVVLVQLKLSIRSSPL